MTDDSLNKSQKFVRIFEIVQRRGGVSAQDLMERFDLDARTLRRYLSDLKDLGLPMRDEGVGADRILSLDPAYARSGVQLTLAEVLSLHFGRTLFTFLDGTSFAADIEGAIERLQPAIARSTSDLTRDLDRKFMAVPEHAKDYRSDPDKLDEIVSALLYSNPADAEYRPARGGFGKVYRLEPLTLATYRQGLYLFARDTQEDKVKSFAVERFERFARLRREKFEYPTGYDPHAVVADSFGITSGPPEDIVARFTPDVALFVRERHWHPTQRIEPLPDGGVRLRMRVSVGPELREWLVGFGPQVRVEAPPGLVAQVREAHRAAAALYADDGGPVEQVC
ncbi:MAG: transcriptional regulator [Pseudomonadota bacterium]|nr:transcriptional regulator [Pseudomonadota bacterium]